MDTTKYKKLWIYNNKETSDIVVYLNEPQNPCHYNMVLFDCEVQRGDDNPEIFVSGYRNRIIMVEDFLEKYSQIDAAAGPHESFSWLYPRYFLTDDMVRDIHTLCVEDGIDWSLAGYDEKNITVRWKFSTRFPFVHREKEKRLVVPAYNSLILKKPERVDIVTKMYKIIHEVGT